MAKAKKLTAGEVAMRVTFNPSQNPDVDALKKLGAKLFDMGNKVYSKKALGDHDPLTIQDIDARTRTAHNDLQKAVMNYVAVATAE